MQHVCPDGKTHEWEPRVKKPKVCPRCKSYLDKSNKEKAEKKEAEVIDVPENS